MGLDLNNPAIAAVFGGVCTGVIHINIYHNCKLDQSQITGS
jgi:hypothetical protein